MTVYITYVVVGINLSLHPGLSSKTLQGLVKLLETKWSTSLEYVLHCAELGSFAQFLLPE